jgi:hypothetical protein
VCGLSVVVMEAVTREMEEALGGGILIKGCADGGVRGKAEQKVERALLFRSCSSKGRGAPTVLRRRVVVCQCIRAAGFK